MTGVQLLAVVRPFALITTIAAAWALGAMIPAQAASLLEMNTYLTGPRYDGVLPPCEAGLGKVSEDFAEKESRFWNSALQIVGYEQVRQIAYRPWVENTIPRRFCSARALVSDGRHRMVYYSIGEDTGFLGATWGVTFCVVGLDRNLAYSPHCRMARP
jgi:hypothetical protein